MTQAAAVVMVVWAGVVVLVGVYAGFVTWADWYRRRGKS